MREFVVGQRLARLALHLVYKQDVTPNGPAVASAQRSGANIIITFSGVDGRLVAHSGKSLLAFEACGAGQSSCRFADAHIEGNTVVIRTDSSDNVERIRYCWGDAALCNLYDSAGLPAGPFEIAEP